MPLEVVAGVLVVAFVIAAGSIACLLPIAAEQERRRREVTNQHERES